jgi:hypothetical protein
MRKKIRVTLKRDPQNRNEYVVDRGRKRGTTPDQGRGAEVGHRPQHRNHLRIMSITPPRDWPDGTATCRCIHCKSKFRGRSGHIKVCQACAHIRKVKKHLTYYILMERGGHKMIVGPYPSMVSAQEDLGYWHKRHGWTAQILPLMHRIRDRTALSPRGPLPS